MKILFVCTGNTCRSVIAHGFLEKLLVEKNVNLKASSAGTAAFPGDSATPEAAAILQEEGIDFSHHRSRRITAEILQEADLVLAMTRNHLTSLQEKFPAYRRKIHLFALYCLGEEKDIPDPYGSPGSYQPVAEEIKRGLERLLEKLELEKGPGRG